MKKLVFVTGTRADYGKLKALMRAVEKSSELELYVYVSGMHLLQQYGSTYREVEKEGYQNIYPAFGQRYTGSMSYNLGDVVCNLTGYVEQVKPDMIVVHGDRIDALAGAIVGALNNIRVAHIEGGEITGTIDESIRHAISKFAHIHFVSNEEAKKNLIQMGERKDDIYVIGSPDIDIMLSDELPTIATAKKRYDITFDNFAIFTYHPVTTELDMLSDHIKHVCNALVKSEKNYIVIYPNNDSGSEIILNEIKKLKNNKHFRIFDSIRFEYFLTFLKNAECIVGNSSAGIHEAGVYGTPTIDIGTRQSGRYELETLKNIQWVSENETAICKALDNIEKYRQQSTFFGSGNSTDLFMEIMTSPSMWERQVQKKFVSLNEIMG